MIGGLIDERRDESRRREGVGVAVCARGIGTRALEVVGFDMACTSTEAELGLPTEAFGISQKRDGASGMGGKCGAPAVRYAARDVGRASRPQILFFGGVLLD